MSDMTKEAMIVIAIGLSITWYVAGHKDGEMGDHEYMIGGILFTLITMMIFGALIYRTYITR